MRYTVPLKLAFLLVVIAGTRSQAAEPPAKPAEPKSAVDPEAFKLLVFGDSNAAGYGPYVGPAVTSSAGDYGPFDIADAKTSPFTSEGFYCRWVSYPGKTASASDHFLGPRLGNMLPKPMVYDAVIYQMGTNDSARRKDFDSDKAYVADVRAGVAKAMATLKNDYKAKTIYIALPPPIYHDPTATAENLEAESLTKSVWFNVSLEKILPAIREVAKENNIKIIDVNAEFKNKVKAFGKGVHYNESGKKKVAEMYADALRGDIDPITFHAVAGDRETEVKTIQPGKVRVKTSFINNTLPAQYRPKLRAVLYKDEAGQLTEVLAKSLDEQITPKSRAIQVEFEIPAPGKYVIKTFAWRDTVMKSPNRFSAPFLTMLK